MKNFTLLLVPLLSFVASLNNVTGQDSSLIPCKEPNTAYFDCKNKCSDNCPTYPMKPCTEECQRGCFCARGYSRADNGTCIPTGDCPVKCPADQVFEARCTDACNDYLIKCSRVIYSCYCKDGLKRINGKCLPVKNCYNCSGENEVYNECTNTCDDTCQDKNYPKLCPSYCSRGCSCQKDFKRSPKTGKCIPIKHCDAELACPENSSYECSCDDYCYPQISCKKCFYGCHCNTGYKRINDKCVPEINCKDVSPPS